MTAKEKKRFRAALSAPFFNQRKDIRQLFELLEKDKNLEKAVIFKKLYPKHSFSDAKIRFCMSLLLRQLEQFFLIEKTLSDKNEAKNKITLANIFLQKDLSKHADFAQKTAQAAIESQSLRNATYFQWQQEWLETALQLSDKTTSETALNQLSDALNTQFILQKLKEACTKTSLQSVYSIETKIDFLETCLSQIKEKNLLQLPAIAVYFHCYHFLKSPEKEDHFEQFNTLLFQNAAIFSQNELSDLVIASINFCVRQYNSGNRAFLQRHFELYQFGFANNIFLLNGELSSLTYQNAVTFGLILQKFDWVKAIIEDYKNFLPKQFRSSSYSFNLARFYYEQNKKDEALVLLQKADSKDILLSISAKMLQLQIYYELEEYDLLQSHISAMKAYIRRKKIMGYHREIYSNSLKFTQKLLDLNPYSRAERQLLKERILATKVLAEKEWLLRQVEV